MTCNSCPNKSEGHTWKQVGSVAWFMLICTDYKFRRITSILYVQVQWYMYLKKCDVFFHPSFTLFPKNHYVHCCFLLILVLLLHVLVVLLPLLPPPSSSYFSTYFYPPPPPPSSSFLLYLILSLLHLVF